MSDKYPSTNEKHPRSFCSSLFDMFPSWLEYSPKNDVVYCLVCYLTSKPTARDNLFVVGGFRNWKKVGGEDCSFHKREGKDPNSSHKIALKACNDLMNSSQHIEKLVKKHTSEQIATKRLIKNSSFN